MSRRCTTRGERLFPYAQASRQLDHPPVLIDTRNGSTVPQGRKVRFRDARACGETRESARHSDPVEALANAWTPAPAPQAHVALHPALHAASDIPSDGGSRCRTRVQPAEAPSNTPHDISHHEPRWRSDRYLLSVTPTIILGHLLSRAGPAPPRAHTAP